MYTIVFAERLEKVLIDKKIKQNKLAKETGISSGLITHYVKNNKKPSTDNLLKIVDYLNVSADYLLGRTSGDVFIAYDIYDSEIKQGHTSKPTGGDNETNITDKELLLLRIFRNASLKAQNKILTVALELEEKEEEAINDAIINSTI